MCIDRFSRWTEVFPLSSIDADKVTEKFLAKWVSRYRVIAVVVMDRSSLPPPSRCLPPGDNQHGGADALHAEKFPDRTWKILDRTPLGPVGDP